MEKNMNKTWVILLVTALCLTQAKLYAEEDPLLAANQNFGTRKPATSVEATPVTTPAATVKPATIPAPATAVKPVPAPTTTAADPVVQDEVIRRQEAQLVARKMIDEGQKLYHDGKYAEAIAKLEAALKILPKAKATEVELSRAKHSLTESYYQLADSAYRAKDNTKAKEYAAKALEYDSDNTKAENILVKVKWAENEAAAAARREKAEGVTKPTGPEVDKSPAFIAKQNQIKKLFREAKLLANTGQFGEAEKRYKQVLLLDHYNDDAYRHLENLHNARMDSADFGRETEHARRMWEVADAWIPPIGNEIRLPEMTQAKPIGYSKDQTLTLEKLNKITFPEINFREAVISDVVNFLSTKSRELDPDKVGINIVLGAGVPAGPAPAPGDAAPPAAPGNARPITLSLRNVPMVEVLKYVCSLANLKYRVESNAVLILPFDAVEGAMVTRSYPVNSATVKPLLATPTPTTAPIGGGGGDFRGMGGGGAAEPIASAGDIKQFFVDAGVPFPAGASLSFNERTSKLTIRNTAENMEIFERVLADLNVIPNQVEIEAKFVDISEGDLKELGFNWYVGGNKQLTFFQAGQPGQPAVTDSNGVVITPAIAGGWLTPGLRDSGSLPGSAVESLLSGGKSTGVNNLIGTFTSFLSRPDLSVVINALAQRKGSDVLSAPKITTISGAQAQVRVVQEFIYPTEFSTPTAGSGGSGGTASIPSAFRTREVGVILNVTPTVGPDGYTINLTLVPEVSEFRGFIDYSPDPTTTAIGGTNSTVAYKIIQPLFETRNVQTSVVIWDGQTVVLGGLMREDVSKLDDKVPFLGDLPVIGRLFRSKVTSRSKRNLLIFVTANLVDPAGNKIHRQDVSSVAAPLK
jgi:general secretion pathway protein D